MTRSYARVEASLPIILGFLATISLLLGMGEISPTYAQTPTPTCNPNTTPHVRSPDPRHPFFRQNDTVYVIINSNITAQTEIDQIGRGLASWTNVAGIQFIIGPPPANGPFSTGPEPTVIYFQNGNLGRFPYASTVYGGTHADGSVATATITFDTDGAMTAQTPGGPNDGPFYNPNLPGYDTIFQKETEHEIGHPMGLDDASGENHESVMNVSAFDCPNDVCGMKPLLVDPCDKAAAQQVARPLDTGSSDPGSGGGGGGGTGDCPCGDCVNGCNGSGGGGGSNCDWVDVGGQCYAGVDSYDDYGVLNGHEDGYCDQPQLTYVCW